VKQRIIFRADGNEDIGYGHFFRLLGLLDILKDDFNCIFAINRPDNIINQHLKITGIEIIALNVDFDYKQQGSSNDMPFDMSGKIFETDIIIVDGYHFGKLYQEELALTNAIQVFVDDLLEEYPHAKAVINHAPGIDKNFLKSHPKMLSGLDYIFLRKDFFDEFMPSNESYRNIYVCMGGADKNSLSISVCESLLQTGLFRNIHVICTENFDSLQLKKLNILSDREPVILHFNLSGKEVISVMNQCEYAFVSASTVLIEAYSRGLKCFTGYTIANQNLMYNGFIKERLAIGLGDLCTLSSSQISAKIKAASFNGIDVCIKPLNSTKNFINLFKFLSSAA
jgi:UDP-2,4-diacetamido-2,4,6-trideoxy-beta-L-altropyranose hydrolase